MESALKTLRIIRVAMLASVVLYGIVCFRAPVRPEPAPTMLYCLVTMSVAFVGCIFFFRRKLVLGSELMLATQPDDRGALGRWRAGYIITWALCESIVLYGLVLRFMGFTFVQVLPFLGAGFVLMLFFSPRKPVESR